MITLIVPLPWASGITMFSRASDSGTSSMTEAGISISRELDEGHAVLFGLGLHDVVGLGVPQLDQRLFDRTLPIRWASLS